VVRLKNITREMLKIYKPISGMDWMNYKIVRKDQMTAHHLLKKSEGGRLTLDNIALLLPHAHQYLHLIEFKDIEIYNAINKIFKIVNQQGCEPTTEQRQIIEYFLLEFEKAHKSDKNSKGNALIKYKYLQRGL